MKRLQREWARIERHGGQLSFIMADIDHFKHVNDVYGHQIGDKMIQEVAGVIAQQCRDVDLPVRYGGEEFAIVVADETASGATRLADRCRQEIAKVRVAVNGETVAVTASFGVADASNLPSLEALVKRADEALYQAKKAGRNLVCACDTDMARAADIGSASRDITMDSGNIAGCLVSFSEERQDQ
jgi:two-component system, cell cycle response regulator